MLAPRVAAFLPQDVLRARRRRLKYHGIEYPWQSCAAARQRGCPLALFLAVLDLETGGGANVFGHDRDRNGRYIWPARDGTVWVTKDLYERYKRRRRAGHGMQGVGPAQLTWYTFQDEADALGGCWRPRANMYVAAGILARYWNRYNGDVEVIGAAYNGSREYGLRLEQRYIVWQRRLGLRR